MLVKFTVENFKSFKDRATIDMSAEALKEKGGFTHRPFLYSDKAELLKSAVIYGYNAFGKSNLLRGYAAYRNLILHSINGSANSSLVDIEPFRLNTATADKPSYLESIFILRGTKYRYGFMVSNQRVIEEWLYYADGSVRENALYVRLGQEFIETSKLWNKLSENKVEQAKFYTKPNHLFLSILLSQDSIPRITDIGAWFNGNTVLHGDYSSLNNNSQAAKIYTDEQFRSVILKFLDNADLGFKNIYDKLTTITNISRIHSDLVNVLYDVEKSNFELYTQHPLLDENHSFQKMVEFHLNKNESSGSIKYFIVACYLAFAIKSGQLVWIDELDASLHTQLLVFLVDIFNSEKNNISGAQVIFTTHNTVILDNILRRDQIWFVDKNEHSESKLYKGHSKDNPIRVNKSIEQEYRTGKVKRGASKKIKRDDLPSLFSDENTD